MYRDQQKKSHPLLILLCLLVILAASCIFLLKPGEDYRKQAMESISRSVTDRALQCYVVEGVYPPDLEYLQEHYGLTLNQDDYNVHYDIFAQNLPPDVRVVLRRKK